MKNEIDNHILELFAAMDLENVKIYDGNNTFVGINQDALYKEAAVFLSHLSALGVEIPTAESLAISWRSDQ